MLLIVATNSALKFKQKENRLPSNALSVNAAFILNTACFLSTLPNTSLQQLLFRERFVLMASNRYLLNCYFGHIKDQIMKFDSVGLLRWSYLLI